MELGDKIQPFELGKERTRRTATHLERKSKSTKTINLVCTRSTDVEGKNTVNIMTSYQRRVEKDEDQTYHRFRV